MTTRDFTSDTGSDLLSLTSLSGLSPRLATRNQPHEPRYDRSFSDGSTTSEGSYISLGSSSGIQGSSHGGGIHRQGVGGDNGKSGLGLWKYEHHLPPPAPSSSPYSFGGSSMMSSLPDHHAGYRSNATLQPPPNLQLQHLHSCDCGDGAFVGGTGQLPRRNNSNNHNSSSSSCGSITNSSNKNSRNNYNNTNNSAAWPNGLGERLDADLEARMSPLFSPSVPSPTHSPHSSVTDLETSLSSLFLGDGGSAADSGGSLRSNSLDDIGNAGGKTPQEHSISSSPAQVHFSSSSVTSPRYVPQQHQQQQQPYQLQQQPFHSSDGACAHVFSPRQLGAAAAAASAASFDNQAHLQEHHHQQQQQQRQAPLQTLLIKIPTLLSPCGSGPSSAPAAGMSNRSHLFLGAHRGGSDDNGGGGMRHGRNTFSQHLQGQISPRFASDALGMGESMNMRGMGGGDSLHSPSSRQYNHHQQQQQLQQQHEEGRHSPHMGRSNSLGTYGASGGYGGGGGDGRRGGGGVRGGDYSMEGGGRGRGGGFYSPTGSSSSGMGSPIGLDFDEYYVSGGSPRGGGHRPMDFETKRCSNAIKKLCSAGNVTEVFAVLEDMLGHGLVPDLKTVKTIMRTCVKKLAWRRAVQLLHTTGLPLDVVIFTMAINTCGKAGEWEQGLRVLREMDSEEAKAHGIVPNEVSYGTAISACGKAGRWELALSLLNEVKDRGLLLNDVCYGGAIDACGRAGQWQEALKLLNEMTLDGVAANEVCYNSAISACGKAGEWEKAVALLREMRERGLTPDELNYNSAISACGKAAQWAHAIRLLREMAVRGLCPDVVSYGAAIDACRKAGKYDRGLALLGEMRQVGLVPNEVCYHSAVTACSEAGRWNEALFVLSEMVKQGLKPDAISYNAAVEACAKSGKWDALVILLQETARDPDTTLLDAVYNNAVITCAKYGNWELAATVLQEMEYLGGNGGSGAGTPGGSNSSSHPGLSPTSASYSAVIDACAKALAAAGAAGDGSPSSFNPPPPGGLPQWELILSKLDRMREKGLLPDSSSYNAAVRACVCGPAKHWKKAVDLLQEMASKGYLVDQSTSNAVMQACTAGVAGAAGSDAADEAVVSSTAAGGMGRPDETHAAAERERALALLRKMMAGGSPFDSTSSESSGVPSGPPAALLSAVSSSRTSTGLGSGAPSLASSTSCLLLNSHGGDSFVESGQAPLWERTTSIPDEIALTSGSSVIGEVGGLGLGGDLAEILGPSSPTGPESPRPVGLIGSPSFSSIPASSTVAYPRSPAMALGPGSPFLSATKGSSTENDGNGGGRMGSFLLQAARHKPTEQKVEVVTGDSDGEGRAPGDGAMESEKAVGVLNSGWSQS